MFSTYTSRIVLAVSFVLVIVQHAIPQTSHVVGFASRVEEATKIGRVDRTLANEEMFYFGGWSSMVDARFWRDNEPAKLFGLRVFRTGIPGLIHIDIHTRRQGRLLDVTKPPNPNGIRRGPLNPNPHPFMAGRAFLTEIKVVTSHDTLVLSGRYKDDERGKFVIPPTDATLSFMKTLRKYEDVHVYVTFTLEP